MAYSCKVCLKTFTKRRNLTRHERSNHGQKKFSCDQCSKSFRREDDLKRHQKQHQGMITHTCKNCRKGFHRRNKLVECNNTHIISIQLLFLHVPTSIDSATISLCINKHKCHSTVIFNLLTSIQSWSTSSCTPDSVWSKQCEIAYRLHSPVALACTKFSSSPFLTSKNTSIYFWLWCCYVDATKRLRKGGERIRWCIPRKNWLYNYKTTILEFVSNKLFNDCKYWTVVSLCITKHRYSAVTNMGS